MSNASTSVRKHVWTTIAQACHWHKQFSTALAFMLVFALHMCEPGQRKCKVKKYSFHPSTVGFFIIFVCQCVCISHRACVCICINICVIYVQMSVQVSVQVHNFEELHTVHASKNSSCIVHTTQMYIESPLYLDPCILRIDSRYSRIDSQVEKQMSLALDWLLKK